MSKPHYEGEIRVGVPHDVVEPNIPPVLKRFDRAWPRVQRYAHVGDHRRAARRARARRSRRGAVDRTPRPKGRRAAAARSAGLGRRARAGRRICASRCRCRSAVPTAPFAPRRSQRWPAVTARLASHVRGQRARRGEGDALRRHRRRADAAVGGAGRPDGAGSRGWLAAAAAVLHQHASAPRRPLGGGGGVRFLRAAGVRSRYGERRQAAAAASEQR